MSSLATRGEGIGTAKVVGREIVERHLSKTASVHYSKILNGKAVMYSCLNVEIEVVREKPWNRRDSRTFVESIVDCQQYVQVAKRAAISTEQSLKDREVPYYY